MQVKCKNRNCGRLIADVEDPGALPDILECQHCHHRNIVRRSEPKRKSRAKVEGKGAGKKTKVKLIAPASATEIEPKSVVDEPNMVEEESITAENETEDSGQEAEDYGEENG
jgi:transcription elongation factor Elf1